MIQMMFTLMSVADRLRVKPGSDNSEVTGICALREESCWEIWLSSMTDCCWKNADCCAGVGCMA